VLVFQIHLPKMCSKLSYVLGASSADDSLDTLLFLHLG
jgi:hypothetical protein